MEKLVNILSGEERIDLNALFQELLSKWYVFAICIPLGLGAAYIYGKLQTPIYKVNSKLLIQEEKIQKFNETEFMDGLQMYENDRNFENELGILTSYATVAEALKLVDFSISYHAKAKMVEREIYQDFPFKVVVDSQKYQLLWSPFQVEILGNDKFRLSAKAEEFIIMNPAKGETNVIIGKPLTFSGTGTFGVPFENEFFSFTLEKTPYSGWSTEGLDLYFVINDELELAHSYQKSISAWPINEDATIVDVAMEGPVLRKSIDFVNALCASYINNDLREKNQAAAKTIEFIDGQLSQVSESLKQTENRLASFRSNSQMADPSTAGSRTTDQLRSLQDDEANLKIAIDYYKYLLGYLKEGDDFGSIVIPSSVGIGDPLLNASILDLKQFNSEKVSLSYTAGSKSFELDVLNKKIASTQKSILDHVRGLLKSSQVSVAGVQGRIAQVEQTIRRIPQNEVNLTKIKRNFDLNDNLYNSLMEKRSGAEITLHSNTPDAKVLEDARLVGNGPISPNKKILYFFALMLSVIFPALAILFFGLKNDKLRGLQQIEKLSEVPILANIVHEETAVGIFEPEFTNSALAESFRYLKARLSSMIEEEGRKVAGITSTVNGEGKTFCAAHLSAIMAMSGKKTLLVEADIRKPKLKTFTGLNGTNGLTTYLDGKTNWEKIVQTTKLDKLHVISSGPTVRNPSELLSNGRLEKLLVSAREKYDFILMDTPPVGMVSDYLSMHKHMDVSLYVVREQYSRELYLQDANRFQEDNKKNPVFLIVNDASMPKAGYGYYGYGGYYSEESKG